MSGVDPSDALVVVTGAGSGIGAATALRFADHGARVVAVDIDGETAVRTAQACLDGGARAAHAAVCDVADAAAVAELAAGVERDHDAVDMLVNNAGVGVYGPFLESALEDWEWLRSINLDGVVHGCHAFGSAMLERGRGQVVNVASGAGYMVNANLAGYCATKSAVIMLSQCLRADWAPAGVGVSVVCPGVINTPIARATRMVGPAAGRQETAARRMRFGHSPDVVAAAIMRAAERNHDVVPVGFESALAYRLLRHAPGPVQGLLARVQAV